MSATQLEHDCVEIGNAYLAPYRPCPACEAAKRPTALVLYDRDFAREQRRFTFEYMLREMGAA